MTTRGLFLRAAGPSQTGVTTFHQGLLGAGGYASGLIMASDGSAMTMRNDTACSFIWSRSTNQWRNMTTQPGMTTIQATTPLEAVFAPSNPNIMYMVYEQPLPVEGAGGGSSVSRNYLWKSTDKGTTWTQTNSTVAISGDNPYTGTGSKTSFSGPRMAVDPKNSDVVYIISTSAAVYVTYDGGTTISVISGLLAALPSAVVNGSAPSPGNGAFTVVSNPIDGLQTNGYSAFDPTWPLACGTNGQDDCVTVSSGTNLSIQRFQSRDGGTGALSIGVGDTIYFGRVGSVCVDGSSDTIANPGGSGVISKTVYVSWIVGASHIWRTMDGGSTWAAMSGGPSTVSNKMKMSNDGAIAGGGFNTNILYVCDGTAGGRLWRYVENPPTGSSLSSATWTSVTSGLTSDVLATTNHPTLAGHAAALNLGGGLFVTTDFGTTWSAAGPGSPSFTIVPGAPGIPPNGTDTPWLAAVADISMGDCEYDTGSGSTPNKIWLADGIGILWSQVTANFTASISAITKDATGAVVTLGTNDWIVGMSFIPSGVSGMTQANGVSFYIQSILGGGQVKTNVDSSSFSAYTSGGTAAFGNTFVAQSAVMDSLTMQKIVKAPAPNGRILMAAQDRQFLTSPNVTTYPTTFFPLGFPSNPTDITYSKADPATVWGAASDAVYRSTDSGVTFTISGLSKPWCMLASTAASSCVANPLTGTNVKYTTDGGSTWNDCLFAGNPLDGTATGPFQGLAFFLVCDDFSNYYYWRPSLFINGITGITKDATGAVFTLAGNYTVGQSFVPNSIGGMTQANGVTFTITAVPPTGGLSAGTFKTNVDSSGFSAYTSGGFTIFKPTFWKSTDGGANFTLKSTTNFNPGGGGSVSDGATFCCPQGVNGDVWFCPGGLGSWIFRYVGYYSNDSGATWTAMNQAGDPTNLYHLAFGKPKPGGTGYPAAYMTGFMADPTTSSMWRCDDPTNAARVWTEISGFYRVDPEGDRYLTADTEEYGTSYRATYSTGYVYGKIS